jgi:hypothetical protein
MRRPLEPPHILQQMLRSIKGADLAAIAGAPIAAVVAITVIAVVEA